MEMEKILRVVITGGNLNTGEYMVREMTPSAIFETLRDGFTVVASGSQPKVKYVNLDNGTVVRRDSLSDDEYETLKVVGAIWMEFER